MNLDGNRAIKARVARVIHLSHAARAYGGENFVWP